MDRSAIQSLNHRQFADRARARCRCGIRNTHLGRWLGEALERLEKLDAKHLAMQGRIVAHVERSSGIGLAAERLVSAWRHGLPMAELVGLVMDLDAAVAASASSVKSAGN